jgi:hypothetical protein
METITLSSIFSTIMGELQDIAKEYNITARQVWCTIEH